MKNYDFDYVVPLEVLHKNHKKAYKEYCDNYKKEQEKKDMIQTISVISGLFMMFLSIGFAFLSYFFK